MDCGVFPDPPCFGPGSIFEPETLEFGWMLVTISQIDRPHRRIAPFEGNDETPGEESPGAPPNVLTEQAEQDARRAVGDPQRLDRKLLLRLQGLQI